MVKTVTLFPLGAIVICIFAILFPEQLRPLIVPLLGIVMFGMGMTLTPADFLRVFKQPKLIGLGISLQFLLMPLIAFGLSLLLQLPVPLMAGLVLVGACPGGTASNVICYLARGDVALSITLTSVATVLAVVLTPVMTWIYVGQKIAVPVIIMMFNILKIIIIPVALGLIVNNYFGKKLEKVKNFFPVVSVLAIIVIIGIIVARNHANLTELALPVMVAVIFHNGLGLLSGYFLPRLLGFDDVICRTLSIEVGMQNSGLGVALADRFFPASAALPGAVFSIWHNISGSCLAALWSSEKKN